MAKKKASRKPALKTKKAVAKKAATKKKAPTKKTVVPQAANKVTAKGKTITKEIAQRYLKDSSAVDLSAFTGLDDKAADVLGKSDRWLDLSGVTHLSDAAAKGLASHSHWLKLNGVTSLSDETARILSRRKDGMLELRGVKGVSDTAAKWIASCKGDLVLGVDTLSDASAKAFASFPRKLGLPTLRTLSDGAAKSLEKLDGDGRLEVNDGFCKTMKQLKGYCSTWTGLLQYRGWKLTETRVNWEDMPEKAAEVLEGAFDYGRDVGLEQVEITRLLLTEPKGGQQHEYFCGSFSSCDTPFGWWYVVNDKAVVAEDEE